MLCTQVHIIIAVVLASTSLVASDDARGGMCLATHNFQIWDNVTTNAGDIGSPCSGKARNSCGLYFAGAVGKTGNTVFNLTSEGYLKISQGLPADEPAPHIASACAPTNGSPVFFGFGHVVKPSSKNCAPLVCKIQLSVAPETAAPCTLVCTVTTDGSTSVGTTVGVGYNNQWFVGYANYDPATIYVTYM